MYRLTLHRSLRSAAPARSFSIAASRLQKGPPLSQGHSTDKAHQTGHTDGDVQSASVRAGENARDKADASSSGDAQPFDAARQGSSGGTAKPSEAKGDAKDAGQAGALKDQVGGQDEAAPGVEFGKKEEAAGGTFTVGDSIKKTVAGGFDGLKKLRSEGKNFHTSARQSYAGKSTSPSADVEGSRTPKEGALQGDQNQHLAHKKASDPDTGKGNAAEDPSLPSKQNSSSSGSTSGDDKGLHTTARIEAAQPPKGYAKALPSEGNQAGYNAPPEALPPKLDSPYSAEATQAPEAGLKPASKVPHSSTAVDPPNEALRQAAKDGTLAERNEQPHAEYG
ncbi:hypothetical protein I317_06472 [Kwoniella heveanensis CBS 569]|uniref:Uncharacterized protein n=1 Tax=Kwoniella heveanensis BCC8398 TaxID=1296120 RepID=A0A1B9GM95_9TREE|nr:hypothetical protein I316_06159 [Kwoniella heveanensis BCC8398]OCF39748.1 hypothetical protein I317_06472 [Kwoniella heveanensis CBS 569]